MESCEVYLFIGASMDLSIFI